MKLMITAFAFLLAGCQTGPSLKADMLACGDNTACETAVMEGFRADREDARRAHEFLLNYSRDQRQWNHDFYGSLMDSIPRRDRLDIDIYEYKR
ncbi:MAG: hypothetical protein ACRD98_00400 [Nitrososphaera sp.]